MTWGHPPAAVLHYTPRQMSAWLLFGAVERNRTRAEQLGLDALAASGDVDALKKQVEQLGKE